MEIQGNTNLPLRSNILVSRVSKLNSEQILSFVCFLGQAFTSHLTFSPQGLGPILQGLTLLYKIIRGSSNYISHKSLDYSPRGGTESSLV